ncbi:2,3-diketo-5-methylthio-1-phosphopentane phosphatase [Delitschia confertaspora ATCC 74209]|uniref:2,3-diketo-5-methylthio-1-phosphopentane phosphatase n=1 Tax=Delitschia confertaspora ATCC 74209 TaxID=1513339 RepID=A0A9P4JIX8_9PLEO|nr:2,3-diketo-5-methylthio-1-phosphopentane phosphatase [Delitschia confertaspora ATCC 74209]
MSNATIDRDRWEKTKVVLLDIDLARSSWESDSFQSLIAGFPPETKTDVETLLAHVEDLTRRDIKAVYLKQMQGQLWKSGYQSGTLKTPLYPDVLPVLHSLRSSGKRLAIFSSGSVEAQKQFFAFVEDGDKTTDLNPLWIGNFDTVTAGSKLEEESYHKICRELRVEEGKVTFLTDNVKEAIAATAAGIYTILADRPGNAPLDNEARSNFAVIKSLDELPKESP